MLKRPAKWQTLQIKRRSQKKTDSNWAGTTVLWLDWKTSVKNETAMNPSCVQECEKESTFFESRHFVFLCGLLSDYPDGCYSSTRWEHRKTIREKLGASRQWESRHPWSSSDAFVTVFPLRPHANWTRLARRSKLGRATPCCNNSSVHIALAKQWMRQQA